MDFRNLKAENNPKRMDMSLKVINQSINQSTINLLISLNEINFSPNNLHSI